MNLSELIFKRLSADENLQTMLILQTQITVILTLISLIRILRNIFTHSISLDSVPMQSKGGKVNVKYKCCNRRET